MPDINYSFELSSLTEALTPYGTIDTQPPEVTNITVDDFTDGEHFRTGPEEITNSLVLKLEDRNITFVVDESGSMTWNDANKDRYTYLTRLANKLAATYPGALTANVVGFGGVPIHTNLFVTAGRVDFLTSEGFNFDLFLQKVFEDSVFDFAGVRVVRRTDRFPVHPSDGVIVTEGIVEASKNEELIPDTTYYYGIWSFNKNRHFSSGKFISATPRRRILPQGVGFAGATSRVLPGVKRDEFTQIIYNFQEKYGSVCFDSSGNGRHGSIGSQTLLDLFWSGDHAVGVFNSNSSLKNPVGVKFDGQFDIIEIDNEDGTSIVGPNHTNSHGITVHFWIYRVQQAQQAWIIGTSSADPNNTVGWAISVLPDGRLGFAANQSIVNGLETITGGPVVPLETWAMLTFVINSSGCCQQVFLNDIQYSTSFCPTGSSSNIDTRNESKIYIGAKPTDSGHVWQGKDFAGIIAQVSLSNTERPDSWVQETYNQERIIFDQSISDASQTPPDNKQREVLLNWNIGSDYNYSGGLIKILRKYKSIPSNEQDGEIVAQINATPGEFFYIDAFDFVHNSDYYYRIFTYNSIGNSCAREDARILPVHVQKSINPEPSPALENINSEEIVVGDRKILLQWSSSLDERAVGTRIYFGDQRFPTLSAAPSGELQVTDGVEIFDAQTNSFVHRISGKNCSGSDILLVNGKRHYYTIITYDVYNRVSAPVFLSAVPVDSSDSIFDPNDVEDLHVTLLGQSSLSVQWKNPTIKSDTLNLYFGETAIVFVNIVDVFGGRVTDLENIKLKTCVTPKNRALKGNEQPLKSTAGIEEFTEFFNPRVPCSSSPMNGRGGFGVQLDGDCTTEESVVRYSAIESGVIKGLVTHTTDRAILSRRSGYIMNIVAEYNIKDSDDQEIFTYFTQPATVTFTHPIRIAAVNKLRKFFSASCELDGDKVRVLDDVCSCTDILGEDACKTTTYNGGYVKATQPYICRIELQYKGGSLPEGTPVTVSLFKHTNNQLTQRSSRTSIREGRYLSSVINEQEIGSDGSPTGNVIEKSIVDIEVKHPQLPDWVDIYVTLEFAGLFVDIVHEVRFISSLIVRANVTKPYPDGIDVAEQTATVYQINPDDPTNPDANIPAPDGTLVKWELVKGRHGKQRPFYSTEQIPYPISGVYSTTSSGVAHNVFLGPIGNLEKHIEDITCKDEDGSINAAEKCCLAEEYEIHVTAIVDEENARDAVRFAYECGEDKSITNKRFLMNAAPNQPGSAPQWITWADGIHMLRFQIAKTPAISDILDAECFRQCIENVVGGQFFTLPDQQIIQISAPGEILWNVTLEEDPYTGEVTVLDAESIKPTENNTSVTANIPITGETTDFYIRLNSFIDKNNPVPEECPEGSGGSGLGGGSEASPCEWRGICDGVSACSSRGRKWSNVSPVSGTTSLIINNKSTTLFGGGDYDNGIPPIYAGFKEPLNVRVIEARINGERTSELIVDNISSHTFVVEATFAGEPVPDGTAIELTVEGNDQNIVVLSRHVIYTRQINDFLLNPSGDKRALSFFSISPLPNISFQAKINATCRYDKLGTVNREITECILLSNTINEDLPQNVPPDSTNKTTTEAASSNEEIVYDTVEDNYSTSVSSKIGRMGHFASATSAGSIDHIYHFGGWTAGGHDTDSITPLSEIFDITQQSWSFITDMPTPRCYGMTVSYGNKIYCIGGVEFDSLASQNVVSNKIESFNTLSETWDTTLANMPDGVAYGDAQIVDSYIYVTCGITNINDSSKSGDLNTKIYRYSIADDDWSVITPSDTSLYKRLAPFGFYRDADRHVQTTSYSQPAATGHKGYTTINEDGTQVWTLAANPVFGHIASTYNSAFRWPVSISAGVSIISASLTISVSELVDFSTSYYLARIKLLDLDNILTQNWSSGAGPSGTEYTEYVDFAYSTPGPTATFTADITNLVRSFIGRNNFKNGNYIGVRIEWNGGSTTSQFSTTGCTLNINYSVAPKDYYLYGGAIPKDPAQIEVERITEINRLLDQFRSFILTSAYYQNLTPEEQSGFIKEKEDEIRQSVIIPAFIYPPTGFRFTPGNETEGSDGLEIDISNRLDTEWSTLPTPRAHGRCVYVSHQDTAYFIGGSNQKRSTTLNKVEAIDLFHSNTYEERQSLSRGRAMFGAVLLGNDIYLSGGLTSGHKDGWVSINVQSTPEFVEATGTQSCGLLVTLHNDAGDVIDDDIRIDVRGRIRVPSIDSAVIDYTSSRAADKALGGDGSGNAPSNQTGEVDIEQLLRSQNSVLDPNSDEFQINAARKLSEQLFLFPILYTRTDFILENGIGGTTLLPRSEDPLSGLEKLSKFIQELISDTPADPDQEFNGLTRDELASLGDVLQSVDLPALVLHSNVVRELYDIETIVTILDDFYFGQTVSDFDIALQQATQQKIEEILNPPTETTNNGQTGQSPVRSECLLLQHSSQPSIPPSGTPPGSSNPNNPSGTGGFSQSGQCLFCESILPLTAGIRDQLSAPQTTFFNVVDWIPQIKQRLLNGTLLEAGDIFDEISDSVPFGSSNLYSALFRSAQIASRDDFDSVKKSIYVVSDTSENLSVHTRDSAIEEINAIDGDQKVPVIYTVFSTSHPLSLSALLERTEIGDVNRITESTGGQSTTLTSTSFLNQILNLSIGGAVGGLGYGIYSNRLELNGLRAVMSMTTDFILPSNTNGYVRLRYSKDGYNFSTFSQKFTGSNVFDFADFFAKVVDYEVVLSTGFTSDITEEYDSVATGIPKLRSITFETSQERDDFVFLNTEANISADVQQIAMAFEGHIPESSIVEIGAATSNSNNWSDFQSNARPAVNEFGKEFILERTYNSESSVPNETLSTVDNILYTTNYGAWDPSSEVEITYLSGSDKIPVTSGFRTYPRDGEIYFDTRQPPDRTFFITVTNNNDLRVGMRLRNRLHTDAISIEGIGFIYTTNEDKPPLLSQVPPSALNVSISPNNPHSGDTIFAFYTYKDQNNNKEDGTIISWYKNNVNMIEIQNKKSWSNTDLLSSHRLQPGDKLTFIVTPSDGVDYGKSTSSAPVTVIARPPSAENIRIVAIRNGIINDRYDTSSTLTVEYNFHTDDEGALTKETGTSIVWYVNGVLFKQSVFNEDDADPYTDPKSIQPDEVIGGRSAHIIGSQIQAEVTPRTSVITGDLTKSSIITIENTVPTVTSAQIQPLQPNVRSTLLLQYVIDDRDITIGVQSNRSEVKWFKSTDGTNFSEESGLKNQTTVPAFYLRLGDRWYAEVQPSDGLDLGQKTKSNTVTINA